MARLRTDIPVETSEAPQPSTMNKRKRPKIIVYLKDDGTPDYGELTEEQRAKLNTPGTTGPDGGPASAAPQTPVVDPIPPESVMMLLTMLTSIESAIVARKTELPPEQVARAFEPPPNIANGIVAATTRVLTKYGATIGKYGDELALVSLLVVWQTSAFREISALMEKRPQRPKPEAAPKPVDVHESGNVRTMPDGSRTVEPA